jgi:hypothetical protein
MAQIGLRGVRASFADAAAKLDQKEVPDPKPQEDRHGYRPGQWPGAPADDLPPGCPVTPLGVDGKIYYFVDSLGQMVGFEKLAQDDIQKLFALTPNFPYWAWPRINEKYKSINGLDTNEAKACLYKQCALRGLFRPGTRVRGRGAWLTKAGKLIWHSGDWLYTSEGGRLQRSAPGETETMFYPRLPPIMEPWREPVGPDDTPAHELLAILRSWNYERPQIDPILNLGWLGAALLGGALAWRPTIFVSGDRRVGKSTLQGINRAILGDAVHGTSNTTAAGIYQRVGIDSLPVSVDELESSADNRKVMAVIELARQAASGDMMFRGGANHQGTEFRAMNSFAFSSINIPPLEASDRSRKLMMAMRELEDRGSTKEPVVQEHWGRMILRALLDAWPHYERTLQSWREALRLAGMDDRAQKTYGTLLAIANLLLGDEAMEAAGMPVTESYQLGKLVADITAEERGEQEDNWRSCLEHLMDSTIETWKGGDKMTVGGALERLDDKNLYGDHTDPLKAARTLLAGIGLGLVELGETKDEHGFKKPLYGLAVPKKSPQLERAYYAQKWAGGVWWHALKQAPHQVVHRQTQQIWINRTNKRCLIVDLTAFDVVCGRDGSKEKGG